MLMAPLMAMFDLHFAFFDYPLTRQLKSEAIICYIAFVTFRIIFK